MKRPCTRSQMQMLAAKRRFSGGSLDSAVKKRKCVVKQFLSAVLIIGLSYHGTSADDTKSAKPSTPAEQLTALKKELSTAQSAWKAEQQKLIQELRNAKTPEEREELQKKLQDNPGVKLAPRLLELAKAN